MKNNIVISENNTSQISLYNNKTEALSNPNYTNNTILLKSVYQSFEQKYATIRKEEKTSTIEVYKDIIGYEGHYQISVLGNVKSLKRNSERILSPSIYKTKGYYRICLYKNSKRKSCYIHQLVAITFLGHTPNGNESVIDHIDHDKTNNKLENLQIISNRENLTKDKWRYNLSSSYIGVSFNSNKNKWESSIYVKGKSYHLGYYDNETNAAQEYNNALEYYNKNYDLIYYPFKTNRSKMVFPTDINQLSFNYSQY